MRTAKFYVLSLIFGSVLALNASAQAPVTAAEPSEFADFQSRVAAYSKMRADSAAGLPALPDKATPEQIEAHKKSLQKAIIAARKGAKRGDILATDTAAAIRRIISTEYVGEERKKLRTHLFVAENKTVPVRANSPYPEAVEILEMPPKLLLALPQLPKELRWRFVANSLLLMDNDLLLIVDYMTNALPRN